MKQNIPLKKTNYFTPLICDYIEENPKIRPLYHRFSSVENFSDQIKEKSENYKNENREILVKSLKNQYKNIEISEKTSKNIDFLLNNNTFTITTGHQLNLFTGPLYFIYKIVSVIKTCEILKEKYPDYQFVPVYWQASEDHDFLEINHFNLERRKIVWNSDQKGAVGKFKLNNLEEICAVLKDVLGASKQADYLSNLFKISYLETENLSLATRKLVNELFKDYGLVILDADCKDLKQLFLEYFKNDLIKNEAFEKVSSQINLLENIDNQYNTQVNPREINIFYLEGNSRERIIKKDHHFEVLNTEKRFSEEEILKDLEKNPEKFSPNVILRPLYQEVILPNLCYIGGGGEIAYWLELKSFFESQKVTFPILMLRNSAVISTEKLNKKIEKLNISVEDLFLKENDFLTKIIQNNSQTLFDFNTQKEFLKNQFKELNLIAQNTDASFLGAVKAQETKQLKGLENLEKRLLKAQKIKHQDILERSLLVKNQLFPKGNLQERTQNFSSFYIETNGKLVDILMQNFNPFCFEFSVISV